MVQVKASNIRSGWKIVLKVLAIAARDSQGKKKERKRKKWFE
jgi:hypothetical protein